ncbi:HpcH/HpaI aldolase/citrate lyase family protein (plasmid) [Rhodococcoides fascians]|uniref:HpcH/HpaI aldolase/citrate lyase family protein n=1 Tax=Rhodococcoides fascians TaxID=1828 RepID=UPI00389ABBDC
MSFDLRPRRSALYVPGENERAMDKAANLPADVLIFDLEDSVGVDRKDDARTQVCRRIDSGLYAPREIVVRVNAIDTPWHERDVTAATKSGADAILVPKIESADQIDAVCALLDSLSVPPSIAVWVMIETPRAFLDVARIADAGDRLNAFVIGTNDLISDMRARSVPGRAPVLAALSMSVLAARAAGIAILDGVFNALDDDDGYQAELRQGREMGFDGKTVVHPRQILPANEIFGPGIDEVEYARAVIEAFDESERAGRNVTVVAGQMIEELHVRDARRTLTMVETLESNR